MRLESSPKPAVAFVVLVFLYYMVTPWSFIARIDPIDGEAGYRQSRAGRRRSAEARATWTAATDYRTYSMPGAAGAGRPQLARYRDGYLCAGKADWPDARAFAAKGFSTSRSAVPHRSFGRRWAGQLIFVAPKYTLRFW